MKGERPIRACVCHKLSIIRRFLSVEHTHFTLPLSHIFVNYGVSVSVEAALSHTKFFLKALVLNVQCIQSVYTIDSH